MKITENLEQLPIGEVVPKKVLAVLKRVGLIYDYSSFGYLESCQLRYHYDDGYRDHKYAETFPLGNAPKVYSNPDEDMTWEEMQEKYKYNETIKYKEWEFDTKYLSGCFQPYLVKVSGPTKESRTVNRSMSLWGAIV